MDRNKIPYANLNSETRKLFRLQTKEKYNIKKEGMDIIIHSKDKTLKAIISTHSLVSGILIYSSKDIVNKVELYKLKNFINLFILSHKLLINKIEL